MTRWLLAITIAVLTGGALLLAQPIANYCDTCSRLYPASICWLLGCW